jgi:methyltransferase-like protein
MKHLLNNLTEKEKNAIREQHSGGIKLSIDNFSNLVESKLGNVKPLVNEQPSWMKTIKNLVSPELKTVGKNVVRDMSSIKAPEHIKNLMSKYASVKMTDYVRSLLKPVQDEVAVIMNDIKRIKQYKNPVKAGGHDYVEYLAMNAEQIPKKLNITPGQTIRLDDLHQEISNLKFYFDSIKEEKGLAPQGLMILNDMSKNIDDALNNIHIALSKMAVK